MVCPRCGREAQEGAALCRRCGAPLLIPDDPPSRPLDVSLDLERRARDTLPGMPMPPAPKRAPPTPEVAQAPTLPPAGTPERSAWSLGQPARLPPEPAPAPKVHVRAPAPPVKVPEGARQARPAPAPPQGQPGFMAPPFTPPPQAELPALPRQEDPPGYDPFAFPDLPENDPPELAEPPMTSEADQAFAELTTRVGGGTPAPAPPPAAPAREPAPPPLPPRAAPPAPPPPLPPSPAPPPAPRSAARPLPDTPPRRRPAPRPPAEDLPEAEVTAVEIHVRRAAPWRRVTAWAVDGVPLAALVVSLGAWLDAQAGGGEAPRSGLAALAWDPVVAGSLAGAVALLAFTYFTLAHALAGATLGKRLLRIRVVGPDGGRPSLTRSAFRSTVAAVSAGLLGLGFLLALFTRTGRALHDLVARTWVVEAP